MTRLQSAASAFVEVERNNLERSARDTGEKLIAALALTLLTLVGTTLLLLGIIFLLEPLLGTGVAYIGIGALVTASSLGCVLAVHHSSNKVRDP